MIQNPIGFIDESGGHGFRFEKEGTSTHFVITVVIVDQSSADSLTDEFLKIKEQLYIRRT